MAVFTERLSEALAVAADGIHSASQSAAEKLTSAVSLAKFRRILFIVDSGTLGSSGTLDFQVKGATSSGGSYTAITGTAITQLVKASNDNNYAIVEVSTEQVQALGLGYTHIKGSLLPGTAASNSAVIVLGALNRNEPTSAQNPAVVVQTVAL